MDAINVNAESEIRAARERWVAKQAKNAELLRQEAEEKRKEVLNILSGGHDWWALEYVGEIKPSIHEWCVLIEMQFPGCAPFRVEMDRDSGIFYSYYVQEPVRVGYRDGQGWIVESAEQRLDDADQAVDLAASYGESWFEMRADADRRNAEGLEPPAPEPSLLESALGALKILRQLRTNPVMTDQAITALSLIAIAEQLNLLNDNLMKMDR